VRNGVRILRALSVASALAFGFLPGTLAYAQSALELPSNGNAQMLLAADSLVYDFDGETVTAIGGVQIKYDGYDLVAQKVKFNRKTKRLLASGNVELTQPDGTKLFADEIDVTDNLADGFVNALRVETTDNTRFAAARATRENGNISTFERGVYTACEPCRDKPEKPPTWQIKAETIIWNKERKTIRFQGARFELFGFSLAALPSFEIADHTVKRKSGFLFPTVGYDKQLGASASVPYFWALAPNMNLTLTTRAYSNQGVFASAKFEHQLNSGAYSVTIAGIQQQDPNVFDAGTVNRLNDDRSMIGTKGAFQINPRWTFGWDILEQTDKNFARTYSVGGFSDYRRASEIYLTGLSDRNYFDLRASRFEVQEDVAFGAHEKQATVLPSLDYRKTFDEAVAGGELTLRLNGRNIDRDVSDFVGLGAGINSWRGIAGRNGRLTASLDWQSTIITPGGLSITPIAALRADGLYSDFDDPTLGGEAAARSSSLVAETRETLFRGLVTAGVDVKYPILFIAPGSTHILEPRVQLLARNDVEGQERLGLANEDAQSLVFDASTLFDHDKFSGLDRVEGGVRANVGLRYSGTYDNGLRADALFGQSFHLAGDNPFAAPDLVFAGAFSGLETKTSDYVASASLGYQGFSIGAGARFDEKNLELRRADVQLASVTDSLSLSARYSYIKAQPQYGFAEDRQEVKGAANLKFAENWTASANAVYNIEKTKISSYGFGLRYDDECFTYGMAFSESRDIVTNIKKRSIGFKISLRTLGEIANDASIN
jgi:LPS-assembly protein